MKIIALYLEFKHMIKSNCGARVGEGRSNGRW